MLNIISAKNSGWQALYFKWNGHQFAHLGIDPNVGYGSPTIFGGTSLKDKEGKVLHNSFRKELPHLKWKSGASELFYAAYKFQSRLLMKLDGRKYT